MENFDMIKKITKLRKQKGFSQEELASRCQMNVRSIQRIESGIDPVCSKANGKFGFDRLSQRYLPHPELVEGNFYPIWLRGYNRSSSNHC